uniref:Mediator of RNA polymerase II transcription subunit 24 n=1 Tax=Ditylenchus dipsaci TaxID=166011 RepID=A0A915DXX5_9BILA
MVVVVPEKGRWFEHTLLECLRRKASSEEWLLALNDGLADNRLDQITLIQQCKKMVQYGSSLLCESSELLLEYLDILLGTQNIDTATYITSLTNFDRFERVVDVGLVVDKLLRFTQTVKCTYTSENECLLLCQTLYSVLKWMVDGIAKILNCSTKSGLKHSIDMVHKLVKAIACLRRNPFTGLMIALYFSMISDDLVPDQMPALVNTVKECSMQLQNQLNSTSFNQDSDADVVSCSKDLQQLCTTISEFSYPPSLNWQPYREDFIYKEFRPAILTLGSIFATFRVLKSDEEIANSFLVVGEILGMSRPQIIFDILRSGFLIQLETAAGQPEQRDREALADMFVYLKVPQILLKLVDQGVSRQDVFAALQRVSHSSTLLNELDSKKCDNTFHYIILELKQTEVLQEQQFLQLVANRKQGLEQKPELLELLSNKFGQQEVGPNDCSPNAIRRNQCGHSVLCFCADGDLSAFSSKLASINSQTERATSNDPEEAKNRYVYMDMRLEELVGEHVGAAFCRWTENYFLNLDKGEPMPVDAHLKQNFLGQMSLLKNCKPFWNDSWDFATLIDHVPLIGDILLDEYKKEHQNESEIHNILSTFNHMTCMMLCLVQWLETQPQSSARQAFAKSLRNFGNTRAQECSERLHKSKKEAQEGIRKESSIQDSDDHRWLYTMLTSSLVINFAQRKLPSIYQTEVPEENTLKEAFLYANQQSWASPDVIAHINRCNKSMQQGTWCKCWMTQMLKSWASDEMEMASELCLSAALTNDVPCLLQITRQLVEYVLYDFNSSSRENSLSSSATVLAKMLVRVLILLLWAEDRRKMRERLKAQRNQFSRKRKQLDSFQKEELKVNTQEDWLGSKANSQSSEKSRKPSDTIAEGGVDMKASNKQNTMCDDNQSGGLSKSTDQQKTKDRCWPL